MSDWDEQIKQKAGEVFPDPGAEPPTAEYPLAALRHGKRGAYVLGAKWQRGQLRTDEAVERVARAICRRNWPDDEDFKHYWLRYGDDFRDDARAAIDALLGED